MSGDQRLADREPHPVGRDLLRDVAEIGRCRDQHPASGTHPEAAELLTEDVAEHHVRLHRGVVRQVFGDLDGRAREQRGPLRDIAEPLDHAIERRAFLRAQSEDRFGARGHDVHGLSAIGDHAVHARVAFELLPPAVDAHEKSNDRVQRVTTFFGSGTGVRSQARERDALSHRPETGPADGPFARRGMRRKHGDALVEHALP